MSGGPWGWMAVLALLIYCIRVAGPRYMRDKEPADMRPYLLVVNGLTFGGYITGFCTGLWYANWGLYAFSCSALDPSDTSITMWIRKSVGYVFFGGKVWDFCRWVFARKTSPWPLVLMLFFLTYSDHYCRCSVNVTTKSPISTCSIVCVRYSSSFLASNSTLAEFSSSCHIWTACTRYLLKPIWSWPPLMERKWSPVTLIGDFCTI